MSKLFSYFEGSLEDFLIYIKEMNDNRLVKVRLASLEPFCHVLDNFAVKHIITKHSNDKEVLRGQLKIIDAEIRKGRRELAGLTFYKRKRKLTDAKSPSDSADSGFASFSEKLTGAKSLTPQFPDLFQWQRYANILKYQIFLLSFF